MTDHKSEIAFTVQECRAQTLGYSFPTGSSCLNVTGTIDPHGLLYVCYLFAIHMEAEADTAVILFLKHNYRHIYSYV